MSEAVNSAGSAPAYPPHIHTGDSIAGTMWTVVAALAPAAALSAYLYGWRLLGLMGVGVLTAAAAEALVQRALRRPVTAYDGSAVITGLLIGLMLPPAAPLWLPAAGALFAIIIVKQLFGGLGDNIFNPALAGRAFLLASWPLYSAATLFGTTAAADPAARLKIMALGGDGFSGAVVAGFLTLGGLVLLARRIITWHIPLTYLATVALGAFVLHQDAPAPHRMVFYQVLAGGLPLGAFFMATDPTSSPVSARGKILFALGCGLITVVLRLRGSFAEAMVYAILLMNALVPLIDRITRPSVFGRRLLGRRR